MLGGAIVLALVAVFAAFAFVGAGDDFPDELEGLPRIRSSQADAFEESLEGFRAGDVGLIGAMYGPNERPALIVELVEGPSDQVALIPLPQTFDGAIFGFENSGGGEVDEETTIRESRSGLEIMCAEARVTSDPLIPDGAATLCGWKGDRIGFVFDVRGADLGGAVDQTARIAEQLDA